MLLDEATASLDVETDFKIQKIIKESFSNCTIITIAHRLNTVANYDRILVLDCGKVRNLYLHFYNTNYFCDFFQVVEFDKPDILMKNEKSLFRKMMEISGMTSEPSQAVTQEKSVVIEPISGADSAAETAETTEGIIQNDK